MTLKNEFHQGRLEGYEALKKKLRYNATYYLRIVHEHGGVQAAKLLLNSTDMPEGLMKLWAHGRLDMSLENHVLNPRYHSLFTPKELKIARQRLEKLNFRPSW
jgi:hypothetical protein